MPKTPTPKQCAKCGKMFEAKRITAEYCSKACRYQAWAEAHPDRVAAIKHKHYAENKDTMLRRAKDWAEANPERITEIKRRHYLANRQDTIERARARDLADPVAANERKAKYAKTPVGKVKSLESAHRRRARKLGSTEGHFTEAEFVDLVASVGSICVCCGHPHKIEELERDHIIPLARGGSDAISNIQPLCQPCNRRKSSKTINYLSLWLQDKPQEIN